jgi:hypothetical protein
MTREKVKRKEIERKEPSNHRFESWIRNIERRVNPMKNKLSRKPVLFGLITAMILLIGVGTGTVLAVSDTDPAQQAPANTPFACRGLAPRIGPDLDEAFAGLTQEQKDELYAIKDSIQNSREEILGKLVEFDVLDQETADAMNERSRARYEQNKEEGRLFGAGNKMRGRAAEGRMNGRGGACPLPTENPIEATANQ